MIFEPQDFDFVMSNGDLSYSPSQDSLKELAERANAKMGKWLKNSPMLFGIWSKESMSFDWSVGLSAKEHHEREKTHFGRLVDIKALPGLEN
jgi:hypothetical protein